MRKSVFTTSAQKLEHFRKRDPKLTQEAESTRKLDFEEFMNKNKDFPFRRLGGEESVTPEIIKRLDERTEEAIVRAKYRPVMLIRNNKIVPEFAGPNVEYWKEILIGKADVLNSVIPAIGKVEVNNNATYKWVGTGWLVDTDVIVTNRHVAAKFCNNKEGFVFRAGHPTGTQSARMDFREEDEIAESNEFEIESVLWMPENEKTQPDIAFMRLARPKNGSVLPKHLQLAEKIIGGELVVTIGYPARNTELPDQELIKSIFGEVFDKKRLAPGEIVDGDDTELEHDCSTLQGNSGSPVIELSTGRVMGLHFAGTFMKANFAVSAPAIAKLLSQLKAGSLPRLRKAESTQTTPVSHQPAAIPANPNNPSNKFTIEAMIPLKITVEIGGQTFVAEQQVSRPDVHQYPFAGDEDPMQQALTEAAIALKDYPGIVSIAEGYRFRRGWITDEKVVVVEVKEKQSFPDLKREGKRLIPQEFNGIGVDVRTASLKDQLQDELGTLGIDVDMLEAPPAGGGKYKAPPHLKLERFSEEMEAFFHVSPDSGWPNLEAFIGRIEGKLTGTIYEWKSEHITEALVKRIRKVKGHLKMVTQSPYTEETVEKVKGFLKKKFEHVYASTGKRALFPRAYHIKVATRDEEEFWLSSGNWKDSNQAAIHPAEENSTLIGPLREHNREWHVIIKNNRLAKLFEDYINWDFDEAHRVPKPPREEAPDIDIFIPEPAFALEEEARKTAKYFKPLRVNKELDIHPLLTPDRDDYGQRMFLEYATDLVDSAKATIDLENQSFNLLDDNEEQFDLFLNTLKKKQNEGVDVRIIFRDPREWPSANSFESLQKNLTRIKKIGLDTDNIKVQKGCHTKAIIIDSADDENAAVLFGSHNLTNMGALFNRDASLIVRDGEVARYFQEIFNFDWEVLAVQSAEESVGGARIAGQNEATPRGYRRIPLSELLKEE